MSNRVEEVLKAKPKPGEVGGEMVGYAEAMRQQEVHEAVKFVSTKDEATLEFERVSGKSIGELTEQDFYRLPVVLKARDTANMTELHVVFKDPSMTGHWFNWKSKQPDRVAQAHMQGFTACTKDDVEACHIKTSDENGSLVYGDLVLMKISKAQLWGGYYKKNMQSATQRVDMGGMKKTSPDVPGTSYENSTQAQTADTDYRQVNGARELVYAE